MNRNKNVSSCVQGENDCVMEYVLLLCTAYETVPSTEWNVLQDKVDKSRSEADAAMESKDEAREELNELLQKVESLYLKCTSDMKTKPSTDQKDEEETDKSVVSEKEETVDKLQDEEIDDLNAVDFNENFERKLLELLTLLEYIRMK
ncbi:hypothetical protein TNIN_247541, partial [Trichonephila inaurata madagascariensis]